MKRTLPNLLRVAVLMGIILAACAPIPSPNSPLPQNSPPPVSDPTATQPPALGVPTPTLEPVNLAGPIMEVGSTYPYVDGSILVAVPAGPFLMGSGRDDNPEHTVTLNEFWIYRNEVTNKQYALCVALGVCAPPDLKINPAYPNPLQAEKPVIGVTWDQADAYCKFVSGRLPTEAEWEKTARGPDGNIHPWGQAAPDCNLANAGRCNSAPMDVDSHPEGRSYYGALDLAGNVFEWVADWYSPTYYSRSPAENPPGPDFGDRRSVRSTSFESNFYEVEASRRWRELPNAQRNDLGFRCVVENPAHFAPWCQTVAYVGPDALGSGPGSVAIPEPVCPAVGVSSSGFCNTLTDPGEPAARLNFSPDPLPPFSVLFYPAGCERDETTAAPNDFYCTTGGTASIQAVCTVPPPPVPAGCAPGYTQNGNLCEWTAGSLSLACLPGITYDPATQCCGSIPGATPESYTLCPVDAPYFAGGICQPWPVSDLGPPATTAVTLGSCGGTEACHPPAGGCPFGPWDEERCCCMDPNGGCR